MNKKIKTASILRATKHQRFIGTGYFDEVAQTVAGGKSSTTALAGSTETKQFANADGDGNRHQKSTVPRSRGDQYSGFDVVSAT